MQQEVLMNDRLDELQEVLEVLMKRVTVSLDEMQEKSR